MPPPAATQPKGQQAPEPASLNRRSQPVRQARANPAKLSNTKPNSPITTNGPAADVPVDSFPAVTHFADILTALPKEIVRHLTLFKEVDAKIYNPERELFRLIKQAEDLGVSQSVDAPSASPGDVGAGSRPPNAGPDPFDTNNVARRQLYREITMKLQSMIGSLEEKNHVVTTANITLDKQLARIADVFPYVENEFSDEAKYGNPNHWAYPENRTGSNTNGNGAKSAQNERSRRDGVAISPAAQALADEAAARSDARKQAVQAKKSLKAQQQQQNIDIEMTPAKAKAEPPKKTTTPAKSRKPVPDAAPVPVAPAAAAGNPPKRRKIERSTPKTTHAVPVVVAAIEPTTTTTAAADTTRAAPQPVPSSGPAAKDQEKNEEKNEEKQPLNPPIEAGKDHPEPVSTPAEADNTPVASKEATRKRKAPAAGSKAKSKAAPSQPPSPQQQAAVLDSVSAAVPTAESITLPPSRKPSVSTAVPAMESQDAAATQPAAPEAATDNDTVMTDAPPPSPPKDDPPAPEEAKAADGPETSTAATETEQSKVEELKEPKAAEPAPTPTPAQPVVPKKEHPTIQTDNPAPKSELPSIQTATSTTSAHVTTKSGRTSKPSTPSLATFQEATRPREKAKKSHKKGVAAAAAAHAADNQQDDGHDDDADDDDADEPRYCYCRDFSYGEMVGCDGPDCKGQWFHVSCIGLRAAPRGNAKWYCADCKEERTKLNKRTTGR